MIDNQPIFRLPFDTLEQLAQNDNARIILDPNKKLMRIAMKRGGMVEVAIVTVDPDGDRRSEEYDEQSGRIMMNVGQAIITKMWNNRGDQIDVERQSVDSFVDSVRASRV